MSMPVFANDGLTKADYKDFMNQTDMKDRYWPAEWTEHSATWIAWPHNLSSWESFLPPVERFFDRMIRTIAEVEHVHVLGGPPQAFERASSYLSDVANVTVHPIVTNDVWIRDYGPTFVADKQARKLTAVDWRFNAWGGKWPPWDDDDANARRIAKLVDANVSSSELTCEGGGIETDGEGTLLTTSSCLMASTRNPQFSREQVEAELCSQLGIEKVLWIDGGALAGDDTDSHIDQLVRFSRPGRVLAAVGSSPDDENYPKLLEQMSCLRAQTDARGRSFEIVSLPTPPPRYVNARRVPESYCNFYLANSIIVVPTFGYVRTDDAAIQLLKNEFPDRTLVSLDASNVVWGRGAIHCATQQQPLI